MKTIKYLTIGIIIPFLMPTSCNWFSEIKIPHTSEKVEFSYQTFNVSGELLIPKGEGKYPLVIMVHGDGPAYMSYFSSIKNSFLKAGYATLMWDKPGYGKSTGEFSKEHLRKERAEILLKAIEKMKIHPNIYPDKIGVWGISQAGYVIPMALEKTNDISFMILVGVGGENGIKQTAYYIEQQLLCEGSNKEEAGQARHNFIGLCYATTYDEYYKCAKPMVENPQIKKMNFVSAIWTENEWEPKEKGDEGFYNPIDVLEKTQIPTMVFFGDLDKNVDPIQGFQAYKSAFKKAGNQNFIVKMIEGSDHSIINSETGCLKERRERTSKGWSNYDPEYLQMMEDWLIELKKVKH